MSDSDTADDFPGDVGDITSFTVGLYLTGDQGSGYRTKNDPSKPWQRSNWVQRKGVVDIRCDCIDVIHGRFAPDSSDYATLLVLRFRFDPRKRARRIASVDINLQFSSIDPSGYGPEVYAISLDCQYRLVPQTQQEEITKGADLSLNTQMLPGIGVDGGLRWEKTVSKEVADVITVVGSIDLIGRNWGEPNSASWTLMEDSTRNTGVPASMQVGVLLKREDNQPFQCTFKIKTRADFRSRLETLFGSIPEDDPVKFTTDLAPTNRLMQYNQYMENLRDFDLEAISDVTLHTIRHNAIKESSAS